MVVGVRSVKTELGRKNPRRKETPVNWELYRTLKSIIDIAFDSDMEGSRTGFDVNDC